ncbi:transposase [Granulosicoccus sp. 3-233]|uniref:transposase n=1 Tax=Granulosicoccus sp. 3-233 TaxID=3417969 RepID=UPI003D341A2E
MTNRSLSSAAEAAELVDWYRARWEIEMYFDVLKNGCKVESLQLRTLPSLAYQSTDAPGSQPARCRCQPAF